MQWWVSVWRCKREYIVFQFLSQVILEVNNVSAFDERLSESVLPNWTVYFVKTRHFACRQVWPFETGINITAFKQDLTYFIWST